MNDRVRVIAEPLAAPSVQPLRHGAGGVHTKFLPAAMHSGRLTKSSLKRQFNRCNNRHCESGCDLLHGARIRDGNFVR